MGNSSLWTSRRRPCMHARDRAHSCTTACMHRELRQREKAENEEKLEGASWESRFTSLLEGLYLCTGAQDFFPSAFSSSSFLKHTTLWFSLTSPCFLPCRSEMRCLEQRAKAQANSSSLSQGLPNQAQGASRHVSISSPRSYSSPSSQMCLSVASCG